MPKKTTSINPAESGLTGAEHEVYNIVLKRQAEGETITSTYVAETWGGKNRSYTYRVLKALMNKGFIEQYSQRYYRLTNLKRK